MRARQLRTLLLIFISVLYSHASWSQFVGSEANKDFIQRYNETFRGDMTFVANHIVSINGPRRGTTSPVFNANDNFDFGDNNANIRMDYVDIDNDPSTFSSSAASYAGPTECSKIAYAGLYWSGTYRLPNPTSPNRPLNDPSAYPQVDPRTGDGPQGDFRKIKFKVPGGAYEDIEVGVTPNSTVIFDGYRNTTDNPRNRPVKDVPYVCYIDVTDRLQALETPTGGTADGEYTVANVKTFTGDVDGSGTAAGWVMVVIYEDINLSAKYFSTFDGYSLIRSNQAPVTYSYSGFTTVPIGPVRGSIGVATLEGDFGLPGDQFAIKAASTPATGPNGGFTDLENAANPRTNFFNGSVSKFGTNVTTRRPRSVNTLGFDADLIRINPGIIPNNETGASFRASTRQDTYATFVNALAIEVIEPELFVIKQVKDRNFNDIPGEGVSLGDELFYELTVQNLGNDDAIGQPSRGGVVVMEDRIPQNTDFIPEDFVLPDGVTLDYDPVNRIVTFFIEDRLVTEGAASFTIRFKVEVAQSCDDLRDACSNIIENIADIFYRGVENPNDRQNSSVNGVEGCRNPEPRTTNFIIDLDNCTDPREQILCGASANLTAGAGFDEYEWLDQNGNILGTDQTLTVTLPGTYRVIKTASAPCVSTEEIWNVRVFDEGEDNPLAPFQDDEVQCSIDGSFISEFYLCGDSMFLDPEFVSAQNVEWEIFDPGCSINDQDQFCPNTDPGCWNTVTTEPTFTISNEGRYRLTVTYLNGCFRTFYFNVFTNDIPAGTQVRDIICGNPGLVRVINLPNDYEIALNPNGPYANIREFPVTNPGAITIYYRQISGAFENCVYTVDATVVEQDSELMLDIVNPLCPSGATSTGSINIRVNESQPEYVYTITGPNGFSSQQRTSVSNFQFTGLNPGDYQIEVESFSGQCIDTETATIAEPDPLDATAVLESDLDCEVAKIRVTVVGGSNDYTFSFDDTFTNTIQVKQDGMGVDPETGDPIFPSVPPHYEVNPDGTYTIEVPNDGTYTIYIRDNDSACTTQTNPVTVQPYVALAGLTLTSTNPGCPGESTGTITVTLSGGTRPFTYILDNTLTATTNALTYTFTNVAAGPHEVIVRDGTGNDTCSETRTVDLTDPAALTATAAADDFTCNQEATITITASNGTPPYEYSIDGGANYVGSNTFPNLRDGTYDQIRVRDANGCIVDVDPITIDPLREVTDLEFTNTDITCPALSANVTLTPTTTNGDLTNIEYRITAPAAAATPFGTTNVFNNLDAGTVYTFEARTIEDQCVYGETYLVPEIIPASVSAQVLTNVGCNGEATGSFRFTVTDFTGTYSYTITGPTAVPGGTAITTSTVDIPNLTAGTYTINITDDTTNCTDTATVEITEPDNPVTITETHTDVTCVQGSTVTITANGGSGGYQYQLDETATAGIEFAFQSSNIFVDVPAGSYTVTVQDVNDCPATLNFTIDPVIEPTLAVAGDFCFTPGDPASLEITVTNGLEPLTYTVNGGAVQNVPSGTNPFIISDLTPGTYTIDVTDGKGCVVQTVQTINPQLTIDAVLQKDLDCIGDAEININVAGGYPDTATPNYTVTVSRNGGVAQPVPTLAPFTTNQDGSYVFTVTDTQSCTATSTPVVVTPITTPSATEDVTDVRCFGDTNGAVVINATAGTFIAPLTYELVSGPEVRPAQTSNTFNNLAAGTYRYRMTDGKSCTFEADFTIDSAPEITGTINKEDIRCVTSGNELGAVTFNNTTSTLAPDRDEFIYTLLDSNRSVVPTGTGTSTTNPTVLTTSTSIRFEDVGFGDYFIEVEDEQGCKFLFGPTRVSTAPVFTFNAAATGTCLDGVVIEINVPVPEGTGPFQARLFRNQAPGDLTGFIPFDGRPISTLPGTAQERNHVIDASNSGIGPLDFNVSHFVEVLDTDTNCTFVQEVLPVPGPSITVTPTPTDALCFGDTNGDVSYTITGFNGNQLDIEVQDGLTRTPVTNGTGTITGVSDPYTGTLQVDLPGIALGEGSYVIRITESDPTLPDPCFTSAEFLIEDPEPLDIELVSFTEPTCSDPAQITVRGIDGTPGYTFIAVPDGDPAPAATDPGFTTDTTLDLDPATTTDWDIYVKDANDCIEGPLDQVLTPYVEPSNPLAVVDDQCSSTTDTYSVTVTADTGSGGVLSFSRDNVSFVPGTIGGTVSQYTFTFTNIPAGTGQIFYIRDTNNCAISTTLDIFPGLELNASATPGTCNDLDYEIVATSNGGSGTANHTFELLDSTGTTPVAGAVQTPVGTFTNIGPGDYIVRVTDSGISEGGANCTRDVPVTIAPAVDPVLNASIVKDVDCAGELTPTGRIEAVLDPTTATDPVYTYELSTGTTFTAPPLRPAQTSPIFDGLTAGDYTIRVTSSKGCFMDRTENVGTPSPLALEPLAYTPPSCATDNSTQSGTLTITVTPGTGTAPYFYSFDNGNNFFPDTGNTNPAEDNDGVYVYSVAAVSTTTTIDIVVRDNNGCTVNATQTIEPLLRPDATVAVNTDITCTSDEEITITITGSNQGYTVDMLPEGPGVPSQQDPAEDIKNLPVGTNTVDYTLTFDRITYAFKITDLATGCSRIISHQPDAIPDLIPTVTEGSPITCFGDTDGSIFLNIAGYTGPYTYTIRDQGGNVVGTANTAHDTNTSNPLEITGLGIGNYIVEVTQVNSPFCTDSSGLAPVNGPSAPLMLDANQIKDLTCDPGTDASINAVANGGNGDYTYQLELGATVIEPFRTNGFFEGLAAGTYTIRARDAAGAACEVTQDVIIDAPTNPTGTATPTGVVCVDDKDGSIEVSVDPASGQGVGSYILILTFPDGTERAPLPIAGDTHVFPDLPPGDYTVVITDQLGCRSPALPATITEPTAVEVSVAVSGELTCTQPLTFTVTATGGTIAPGGSYEYGVSTDGGATITWGNTNVFTYNESQPGDYTFYARDTSLCESRPSNAFPIREITDLTIELDTSGAFINCFNENTAVLGVRARGSLGDYEYVLRETTTNTTYTEASPNYREVGFFINLPPGTYEYTVTSRDCPSQTATFTIEPKDEILADLSKEDVLCNGDETGVIRVSPTGGTGDFRVSIANDPDFPASRFISANVDTNNDGNPDSFEFIELPPGEFIVTIADENGCIYLINGELPTIEIEQPPLLEATAEVTAQEICSGTNTAAITLTITGGTPPYFYSLVGDTDEDFIEIPALDVNNQFVITGLQGGTFYPVFIRDANGCPLDPIPLNTNAPLSAEAFTAFDCRVVDNSLEVNNTITVVIPDNVPEAVRDNVTYILHNNADGTDTSNDVEQDAPQNVFNRVAPGEYTLSIRDQNSGCIYTLPETVEIAEYIPIEAIAVVPTENINEWKIVVTGGRPPYTYTVNGQEVDSEIFTIDQTQLISVGVTDSFGCADPIDLQIELEFIDIFIPNYFTPDGDGTNDTWYPERVEFFPNLEVQIFDRYGRLIISYKGIVDGWDGMYQGKLLPSGDYWYMIDLKDEEERKFTGHFTLYR